MARCSHNVVSPLQKSANNTGPNALRSASDNDSLMWTFDATLLSSGFSFRLGLFRQTNRILFGWFHCDVFPPRIKKAKVKRQKAHLFSRACFEIVTRIAMSWRHSSSRGAERLGDKAQESSKELQPVGRLLSFPQTVADFCNELRS